MTITLKKSEDRNYRQTTHVNQHTLYADVGASLGGQDSAPEPHDYYDSALAACKAITLMIYAGKNDIPLTSVDVTLEHDNSEEENGLYVINLYLKLNGDLTREQRQELMVVADKCPLHKLMTMAKTEINTVVEASN